MNRRKPGRERIDRALLSLLKKNRLSETNIAALCREACVSRATFYAHYANVDEMYRELVRQLIRETSTLRTRLKCDGCTSDNARTPLCEHLREGGKYAGLAKESRFLSTFTSISLAEFKDDVMLMYEGISADSELAYALYCFQMMGCIGAARTIPETVEWDRARAMIDAFIRGGLNAVQKLNLEEA